MELNVSGNLKKVDLKSRIIEEFYFICDFQKHTFGWKDNKYIDYYADLLNFEDIKEIKEKVYELEFQKVFQFELGLLKKIIVLNSNSEEEAKKWSKCLKNIITINNGDDILQTEEVEVAINLNKQVSNELGAHSGYFIKKISTSNSPEIRKKFATDQNLTKTENLQLKRVGDSPLSNLRKGFLITNNYIGLNNVYSEIKASPKITLQKDLYINNELNDWNYYDKDNNIINAKKISIERNKLIPKPKSSNKSNKAEKVENIVTIKLKQDEKPVNGLDVYDTYINSDNELSLSDNSFSSLRSNSYEKIFNKKLLINEQNDNHGSIKEFKEKAERKKSNLKKPSDYGLKPTRSNKHVNIRILSTEDDSHFDDIAFKK
jgi:hypothetical protein